MLPGNRISWAGAPRFGRTTITVNYYHAPGADKVEANCAACHSLDYIPMNSTFLNAAGWDAEVTKMISAFGAPISPDDAKIIGDYLKANYGQ